METLVQQYDGGFLLNCRDTPQCQMCRQAHLHEWDTLCGDMFYSLHNKVEASGLFNREPPRILNSKQDWLQAHTHDVP